MPSYWNVSCDHEGETRHASFRGKPKPVSDPTTGKIKGYKGISPFGEPKEFVGHAPYPNFHLTRVDRSPHFSQGQRLYLHTDETVLREIHDATWHERDWHYWVMPVDPSSTATSEWITEKELNRSKPAD